jgi:hypothetical protein
MGIKGVFQDVSLFETILPCGVFVGCPRSAVSTDDFGRAGLGAADRCFLFIRCFLYGAVQEA